MAVTDPVKLIISNYKDDKTEWLEAENNPEDPRTGKRKVPFLRCFTLKEKTLKKKLQANISD